MAMPKKRTASRSGRSPRFLRGRGESSSNPESTRPPGAWAFWTCRLGAGLSPQRLREECMNFLALALVCGASASFCTGVGVKLADAQSAHIEELVEERGPSSKLELTPAQRNAIYQEVHKG